MSSWSPCSGGVPGREGTAGLSGLGVSLVEPRPCPGVLPPGSGRDGAQAFLGHTARSALWCGVDGDCMEEDCSRGQGGGAGTAPNRRASLALTHPENHPPPPGGGGSLREKKSVPKLQFCKKTARSSYVQPWLVAIGGWRLVAIGGWRLVAVGGWWRLVVGRGWWLVAVGGWRLAVGGGWRLAVPWGGP